MNPLVWIFMLLATVLTVGAVLLHSPELGNVAMLFAIAGAAVAYVDWRDS